MQKDSKPEPGNSKDIFNLDDVLTILRNAGNKKVSHFKKVKASFLDNFLFSGKFNSVLGLDGFEQFKANLRTLVKSVNSDGFKSNYMNLDEMFEVLLNSGVYYVEDHLPEELSFLKKDDRWLTAYRYISKNFPEIGYKDFRTIVKRFQETDGHSFYIQAGDSSKLLGLVDHSGLFKVVKDAKASLLQMSMKELKQICDRLNIQGSRSIEETSERIIDAAKEKIFDFLPEAIGERKTLFIKDEELATGADVIHLDQYLRIIAKVVREDLSNFIDNQRNGVLAA